MSEQYYQMLDEWAEAKRSAAYWRDKEKELRQKIVQLTFKDPKEGANTVKLQDGSTVKMTHKITRKVDEATYGSLWTTLGKELCDRVFRHKPDLNLKEYKALSDEQRHLIDSNLLIKEGLPELEVQRAAQV